MSVLLLSQVATALSEEPSMYCLDPLSYVLDPQPIMHTLYSCQDIAACFAFCIVAYLFCLAYSKQQ